MPCDDCQVILDEAIAAQLVWRNRVARLEEELQSERKRTAVLSQLLSEAKSTKMADDHVAGRVAFPERPSNNAATRPDYVATPAFSAMVGYSDAQGRAASKPMRDGRSATPPQRSSGYVDANSHDETSSPAVPHRPTATARLASPDRAVARPGTYAAAWVESQSVAGPHASSAARPSPPRAPPTRSREGSPARAPRRPTGTGAGVQAPVWGPSEHDDDGGACDDDDDEAVSQHPPAAERRSLSPVRPSFRPGRILTSPPMEAH